MTPRVTVDGLSATIHYTDAAVTSQLFDRDTHMLLAEGPGARNGELTIEFPPEAGTYQARVTRLEGERFFLVDGTVDEARVLHITGSREMTHAALRRAALRRSVRKLFTLPVQSLFHNRALMRSMVRRDILGRYRGSFGGWFWTVLNPLLLMLTYFFVFGVVLEAKFKGDPSKTGFALYFLAGMLPWLAFSEAVGRAPVNMLEYRTFIKKLRFPVETLPVNLMLSGLVSEVFGLLIFLTALLLIRHGIPGSVLYLPLLLIPQMLFTSGVCWFLAALGVFVRDLAQINGFLLTIWFFLTPICYSESPVPAPARAFLTKSPIYVLVAGYRAIFLEGRAPDGGPLWKLWVLSMVVFLVGHAWFHKLRKSFADVI